MAFESKSCQEKVSFHTRIFIYVRDPSLRASCQNYSFTAFNLSVMSCYWYYYLYIGGVFQPVVWQMCSLLMYKMNLSSRCFELLNFVDHISVNYFQGFCYILWIICISCIPYYLYVHLMVFQCLVSDDLFTVTLYFICWL